MCFLLKTAAKYGYTVECFDYNNFNNYMKTSFWCEFLYQGWGDFFVFLLELFLLTFLTLHCVILYRSRIRIVDIKYDLLQCVLGVLVVKIKACDTHKTYVVT